MATVQQSIEINVPVQVLYNQLTQFEDYPNFMDDVKAVKQIDDTHMHWATMMANRPVEWDAEITEQEPDRCIAWQNTSGPTNGGRIEVQPIGADASCVTFTLQSMPEQVPGSMAGESEDEMAQRLKFDLVRLKDFLEGRGSATGAWRGEIQDRELTLRDRDARAQGSQAAGQGQQAQASGLDIAQGTGAPRMEATSQAADTQGGRGSPRNAPIPTSSYAAGSEGFAGEEEPTAPVTSASRSAAAQRNDSAGSVASGNLAASAGAPTAQPQQPQNQAQQQAGAPARQVGQMPQDTTSELHGGTPTSDASGKPGQPSSGSAAAAPDRSQPTGAGGTAAVVGAAGGTDASAGARMAGKPATQSSGAPGGAATAGTNDTGGTGPSSTGGTGGGKA